MKDRTGRKSSKSNTRFVFLLAAVILAFIAGSGILLSIYPPPFPELKIEASPPGYPPNGETWRITVWEWNGSLGSTWFKASNASVTFFLETGEDRTTLTGIDGETEVQYRPDYGRVSFEASKSGFQTATWSPAQRFVSLEIVIGFYTFFLALTGATMTLLRSFFNSESNLGIVARICGYSAGLTLVTLSFLAGKWFYGNLYTGATWGFSETVLGPIAFEHLFLGMGVLALFGVLCGVSLRTQLKRVQTTRADNEMIV